MGYLYNQSCTVCILLERSSYYHQRLSAQVSRHPHTELHLNPSSLHMYTPYLSNAQNQCEFALHQLLLRSLCMRIWHDFRENHYLADLLFLVPAPDRAFLMACSKLSASDLSKVRNEILSAAVKWYDVGLELGMTAA